MKSIQNQYRDLKEGRMSQHNFMRNLRMSMPQYITNVTSFNDAVKILKNKAILTESHEKNDQWLDAFQDAIRDAVEASKYIKDKEAGYAKAMKALDHVDVLDMYGMFQPGPGANAFVSDIDDILAKAGDEELNEVENTSLRNPTMAAKAVAQKHGDKLQPLQSDFKQFEKEAIQLAGEEMLAAGMNKTAIRNLLSAYGYFEDWIPDYLDALKAELSSSEDAELEDIIAKYGDEDLGPEKYKFQDFPGGISEAKKKKEAKAELNPNAIHPQELRMGIKVELEHTDDLDKAKKIALDHLAENPFYYTALKLAGVESPSAPKYKAPEEKKTRKKKEAVELVDKANAMQKVKMLKVVKEAKLNLFPGEEPNAVVKQAMEWVDTNLPSISDEIEFQQSRHSPDEAILRYGYWDILPEDAVVKLKSQFNVEADSDEMDDQLPINYYRLKLKKPSFRPGVDLGKSFDKLKSMLEEIVREVVNETYDGRDNLDAENEY